VEKVFFVVSTTFQYTYSSPAFAVVHGAATKVGFKKQSDFELEGFSFCFVLLVLVFVLVVVQIAIISKQSRPQLRCGTRLERERALHLVL
jgi:hypothetical protein